VSKLDAKCNVMVTPQSKGQMSNHSLIKGTDEGAISPMIHPMNLSHEPSSKPRTAGHPKDKDTRLNREHKKGTKR